jgi:hypothetical protein
MNATKNLVIIYLRLTLTKGKKISEIHLWAYRLREALKKEVVYL